MKESAALKEVSKVKTFGGWHKQYTHKSTSNSCDMRFAIFLPPQIDGQNKKVPVLYWLSGLTCTDENFMQKAGALRVAAALGIVIVAPDTSPRGDGVPDDAEESYDFGLGAGFYVNSNQDPWKKHYQMYDYVVKELPQLIEENFPVSTKKSISGHSMGGHGALTIALKNPSSYSSVSAFSPICNPMVCPWGQKAFLNYLGEDQKLWQQYDSTVLIGQIEKKYHIPALVDQGDADNFLAEQLHPEALEAAAKSNAYPLQLRMQAGYDHSYYFISSFIEEHLYFHHESLVG